MVTTMNDQDRSFARSLLESGQIEAMYDFIAGFGHRYSRLASGVAVGNMFSGLTALEFLEETGKVHGVVVDDALIQQVRAGMARGFLDTLDAIAEDGGVTREISSSEAWTFHNRVFTELDLPVDSWTLNTPFKLLDDAERDAIWDSMLDSNGRLLWDTVAGLELLTAVVENSGQDPVGAGTWFQRLGVNLDVYSAWLARLSTEQLESNPGWVLNPSDPLLAMFAATALDATDLELNQDQIREFLNALPGILKISVGNGSGVTVYGTSEGDTEDGSAKADAMYGMGGNDELSGLGGKDVMDGGAGADTLRGGSDNDALYGGIGNDYLYGDSGSDQLNGGEGFDTYYVGGGNSGDIDTIYDSDGAGAIVVDGKTGWASGLVATSANSWESGDGQIQVSLSGTYGGELIIRSRQSSTTTVVKSWSQGGLGVTLPEFVPGPGGLGGTGLADFLNPYAAGNPTSGVNLSGGDGRDMIWGSRIQGGDVLDGGEGNDIINGRGGADIISGGNGGDFISGLGSGTVAHGGAGDDMLSAMRNFGFDFRVDPRVPISESGVWRDLEAFFAWTLMTGVAEKASGELGVGWSYGLTAYFNYNGPSVAPGWTYSFRRIDDRTFALEYFSAAEPDGVGILAGLITTDSDSGITYDSGVSLFGEAGNDSIGGSSAADYLDGGEGNDSIVGEGGHDVIYGGIGNDELAGGDGNDAMEGGADQDLIWGEGGDDILSGGDGDDMLWGDYYALSGIVTGGNDILRGGGGNDQLVGQAGNDMLSGGEDDDLLSGGLGDDQLLGDAGKDELQGGEGNDTLDGGTGDDTLFGEAGSDLLIGGSGKDILSGGDGSDHLDGGADDDQLDGGEGADVLIGGRGDDQLQGGNGDDVLEGAAGADVLLGQAGDDQISGGDGDDTLSGGSGHDVLSGGSGNDELFGDDGDDRLSGEAGNDVFNGGNGQDSMDGGSGDDRVFGGAGADRIRGGDGDDTLFGEGGTSPVASHGDDYMDGGNGQDTLYGEGGNDRLLGGFGDDRLFGEDGDDLLEGGAGNDILMGGTGSNRYHFEAGFGVDHIYLEEGNAGAETITFGSSINQADLNYETYGLDLIIRHLNGTDAVRVHGYFASTGVGGIAVGGTEVANRASLEETLEVPALVRGTASDDTMIGADGGDSLYGGQGNDLLVGMSGNDRLFGGAGDDVLDGGLGSDTLDGGLGNDVYHYAFGGGYDRILNLGAADSGSDIIRVGGGLTRAMIQSTQITGDDLMIGFFVGGAYQALVLDGFLSAANGTHIIEFDDGTWLSAQDFRANQHSWIGTDDAETYTATDAHNNLSAGGGNDIVYGLGGNDRIFGEGGDDQLFGGDGNDVLNGEAGADVLEGGAGNDQLYANWNTDQDADILRGGTGDDRYYISEGYQYAESPDTVVELADEGIDTVYAESYSYTLTNNVENLIAVFNFDRWHWNNPEYPGWIVQIPRELIGNDLDNVIQFGALPYYGDHYSHYYLLDGGAGNDTLIGTKGHETYVVDSLGDVIVEADWGLDAKLSIDTVRASLSYSIAGLSQIENLELVGDGNWSGWGNAADNTLNGRTSAGGNLLYGGLGNDRYILSANDTAVELAGEGSDTVVIEAPEPGTAQNTWYELADYANIENLELGNNLVYDAHTGGTHNGGAFHANLRGDAGDNVLTGNGFSNEIRGGAGNDTLEGGRREPNTSTRASRDYLYGEEGNDQLRAGGGGADLYGGTGDDLLIGGYGNDDFHYARGDGRDTVDAWQSTDTDRVRFAAGIDPDDVTFSRDGLDLVVQVGDDPNDQLIVSGYWMEQGDQLVLRRSTDRFFFLFADGTVRRGDLHQLPYTNNPPQTQIYNVDFEMVGGTAFAASLPAGMFSDSPDDTLTFALGTNAPAWLSIDPVTGALTGTPPNGGDELYLEIQGVDSWGQRATSSLRLYLRNVVSGTAGDDHLAGGQFRDDLHGGEGNDTLTGTGAYDRLYGGVGNDIYRVTDDSQQIIEYAGEGYDTVDSAGYTYTLGEHVEALTLSGEAVEGNGNQQDNVITGNSADNRLDGGAGNDRLVGSLGDDTYVVDAAADEVVEAADEGSDTVLAGLSWQLAANIENLELTGTGDWNATGNALDNDLRGNAGNNRLEGGAGADWLYGGAGDDYFVTESSQDRVIEEEGQGIDTVERRFESNLILAAGVEHLVLANGIVTGNGNELSNQITGNAAANRLSGQNGDDTLIGADGDDQLWGGTGQDQLYGGNGADYLDGGTGGDLLEGGAGNDVYIVDHADDSIVEAAGGGTDQVQASASHVLAAEVENLFLTGTSVIAGTGNALANYLAGNAAANVLNGAGGNDTLSGGAGDDTLIGGAGNDAYLVDAASGSDIVDNTGGGSDTIFFGTGVTRERLGFSRNGDDLLITVDQATTPVVRVRNHFLGGDAAIDFVQPDGGTTLSGAQINQIVAGGSSGFDQVIQGTAAGEQLVGSAGKDLIEGLGGADTLFGMGGNDTLRGGDGNDYLSGGNGNGTGSGNDVLEGGLGNDTLRGEDGSNTLTGGAGDDQYVYGGGTDVISNVGGGTDWLIFQNGITTAQLALTREGNNLLITVGGNASQRVTITDHFLGGDLALDYLQPASGSALNTAAINALVSNNGGGGDNGGGTPGTGNDADYPSVKTGTAAGEQIVGTSGRDLMKGLAGNDTLFGMGADDKLEGGDGDDYLSGGNGSFSGSGKDILIGGAGADQLVGEDGDDMLFGGAGDDTYFYNAASGADTIDNTGGGTDWLYLDGIARGRIAYHRDGDDLIVRVDGNAAQQMRVLGHFLGGERAISYVQPGDGGYAITAATIAGQLTPLPASGQAMRAMDAASAAAAPAALPILESAALSLAMDAFDRGEPADSMLTVRTPAVAVAAPALTLPPAEAIALDARLVAATLPTPARVSESAHPSRELQQLVDSMGSFGGQAAALPTANDAAADSYFAAATTLHGGGSNHRSLTHHLRMLVL